MSQAPNHAIMASNLLKEIVARGAVADPMAIPRHLVPVTNALRSLFAANEEMGETVFDLVTTMVSSGQVTDPSQLLQVLQDFGASLSEVGGQVAQTEPAKAAPAPAATTAESAPKKPKAAAPKAKAAAPKAEPAPKAEVAKEAPKAAPKAEAKGKAKEDAPAAPAAANVDIPPPPKKLFGAALKAYETRMRKAAEQASAPQAQPETQPEPAKPEAPKAAASKKTVAQAEAAPVQAEAPKAAKPRGTKADETASVVPPQSAVEPVSVTGQKPAVPIRASVQPDFIVCLEDGEKMKMLKRHLRTSYNMTPEEYRAKWGLPSNYPMVAPNYAKQKSIYARKVGLGTHTMREEVRQKEEAKARTGD